jgi:hypothetical protein
VPLDTGFFFPSFVYYWRNGPCDLLGANLAEIPSARDRRAALSEPSPSEHQRILQFNVHDYCTVHGKEQLFLEKKVVVYYLNIVVWITISQNQHYKNGPRRIGRRSLA